MARSRIASLAIAAFALTALAPPGAFGQSPYDQSAGAAIARALTFDQQAAASGDAPQLFVFPGLTNKSTHSCGATSATSKSRPKVVATFPADGAVVRPGVVVVRVTFDQPMSCDASFDGASDLPNPCPGRWREVTLSQDRRSFRTVCEVKAGVRYRLTVHDFHNSRGMAVPAEVTFSASGSAPIGTIQQALAEDPGAGMVAGG